MVIKIQKCESEARLQEIVASIDLGLGADYWLKEVHFSDVYVIKCDYNVCGLLLIDFNKGNCANNYYINIQALDIDKRKRGRHIATHVVNMLFCNYSAVQISQLDFKCIYGLYSPKIHITRVIGKAVPNATYYWKKLGANFELSDSKLEKRVYAGYESAFSLSKIKFNKYYLKSH